MSIAHRSSALVLGVSLAVAVPAQAQNTTTRVSVATAGTQANDFSGGHAISADGRFVAFASRATNLVAGDTNGVDDIFVHDRLTGITERVNLGPQGLQATGGGSSDPSISGDGQRVAFTSSATNLVPGDTNGVQDIFVHDRQANLTIRVSIHSDDSQATASSARPFISADGLVVVFSSSAPNLVSGDTNNQTDVFLYDFAARTTRRVNLSSAGNQAVGGSSIATSISADGRFVAFDSAATNLVSSDTNGVRDAFVRDRSIDVTKRVSVGLNGTQGNAASEDPVLSPEGRFVAFTSRATSFDLGLGRGIFTHDLQNGETASLYVIFPGTDEERLPFAHAVSSGGRYICLGQLTDSKFVELFMIDRQRGDRFRVSVASNTDRPNAESAACLISADATAIAFSSSATNMVPGDTNGRRDTFVRAISPATTLDKTTLTFAAVTNGPTFMSQTGPQTIRFNQAGNVAVAWTARSDQPWLKLSPRSGVGSAELSISVVPDDELPPSGTVTGSITVTVPTAANTLPPIIVTLKLTPNGGTLAPFGTVDTPTDHRAGVTGAVPFTGWALDDIEVTRVSICRAAAPPEIAPIDPNCGGAAEIFVGFGVFIDGARPDVAGQFSTYPQSTRAGWGFMVLTNFLPGQGNGTFRFTMRAEDREGNWFVLGGRTMTCANAGATLPFGTIDTPMQGGTASGTFINFGWALTPQPKTIPFDGSTVNVLIDGQHVGNADYNHARPDIQAAFPGFNNTNGAVGFYIFDSTFIANGLHTISWTVTDNAGVTEGIGSRFFTIANGAAAATAAASSAQVSANFADLPIERSPVIGRRGWDLDAPFASFSSRASGVTVIRSEEVNRVELQLGDGEYAGYLRTHAGLAPLPIGSSLNAATNTFTWAPGVGFVGRYDFVFVRSLAGHAVSRRDVRIVLHPKGRGAVGPQVVIDTPRVHASVAQPFTIGGWAVDLDATEGTGVTTLHAWAFPSAGGTPIFLGATAYGGARPDVAAVHGEQFNDSGFGLIAQGLPAGDYDLALFAWSTETVGFIAPTIVRITVVP